MSLGNHKNLIVAGGVIVALLAATVLLGGYAKFSPAKLESNIEPGACSGCSMAQGAACGASFAKNTEESASSQVMAAVAPSTCPAGRTEPCCAENPPKDCCGQPCPLDCPKPCCAKQAEATGCCPAAGEAASK